MGMPRVAGWFLIGIFLPIGAMVVVGMVASTGSPMVTLPYLFTTGAIVGLLMFLLRRWGSSSYYDPRHAHHLFTPYYDE